MNIADQRFEVRRFLYSRPTTAADVDTIRHGLIRWGVHLTEAEIEAACTYLCGLMPAQAELLKSRMGGGLKSWQITSEGCRAYEANE